MIWEVYPVATYVIGLIIFALLFMACRHVADNLRTGGHDCCGCGGCGSASLHKDGAGQAGCSCCANHK